MSISRRKQGARLNKAGRLSPLEVLRTRMEYFNALASEETAKGENASKEKIGEYLAEAQSAAEALAPYRHARLQSTTTDVTIRSAVIRSPELCDSNDEWIKKYVPADLRDQATSPPRTIDGEVVSSTTTSPSPTTPPPSTAMALFNPDSFRLEIIRDRQFRFLRSIDDPSRPEMLNH